MNLGTPTAPTRSAVRRYLAEFLSDRRVIDLPRPLWLAVLYGFILNVRPQRTARAYRAIWQPEGSPLLVLTNRLGCALEAAFGEQAPDSVEIAVGMRYGEPAIADGLRRLRARDVRRLLILPLYPQYSATTTATAFDAVAAELAAWRWIPELRMISHYHDEPDYIAALADSVRQHWQTQGRGGRLLMSFHGLPQRYLLEGDPYHCQCQKTARLLAQRLNLTSGEWAIGFQSRVGREVWLQPYTETLLSEWARDGLERVDVVCPGFAVDCLETLEEIAIRDRALFVAAGGQSLSYIPALNDSSAHIDLLSSLIARHAAGWPDTPPGAAAEPPLERAKRLARAQALGASR